MTKLRLLFIAVAALLMGKVASFAPYPRTTVIRPSMFVKLSEDNDSNSYFSVGLSESDQGVVGAVGTAASLLTLYSEYTLKQTGCGLPAGPAGLLGLAEGLSYISVVGIAAFSLYTKVKEGRGLPAGPAGLLGAAEGLSFVAIVAGLVVLGFQIVDYNYIPNAVPMDGGMCS